MSIAIYVLARSFYFVLSKSAQLGFNNKKLCLLQGTRDAAIRSTEFYFFKIQFNLFFVNNKRIET